MLNLKTFPESRILSLRQFWMKSHFPTRKRALWDFPASIRNHTVPPNLPLAQTRRLEHKSWFAAERFRATLQPCGIDLDVPYGQRNLAKTLGARWDTQRKVWSVGLFKHLTPFKRWLSQPPA